ncbi:hypothetical protein GGR57DRAFT_234634 [Xylariaceae sp. FL1272]|nr:hypothetical protein GGR57DRAFT_234634 [Xylariaceae sp. FL1272]
MSGESDSQDDTGSDVAECEEYEEYESDNSEADEGNALVDDEAEESDGYGHDDEDDEDDYDGRSDYYHDGEPLYEFPQFARLPFELRAMIWELVDPHLKSKQRVMEFNLVGSKETDLWPWAFLEQQSEPARTLLAVNHESRELALKYYPDVVNLGGRLGHVRYNKANDIVLMHIDLNNVRVLHLKEWCDGLKYLGLDLTMCDDPPPTLPSRPDGSDSIEVIFYCFGARDQMISAGQSDWVMSKSTNTFVVETFEESPGVGEDLTHTYYWPDLNDPDFPLDETIPFDFAIWPKVLDGPCRVLPMAIFDFDPDRDLYRTLRRRVAKQNGASSPVSSSDGESVYESEADDYEIGDFVVNTPPEQSEDSGDDGEENDSDVDHHPDSSLLQVGSGDSENGDEFEGFSPVHGDLSDDGDTGELHNAAFSSVEPESPQQNVTVLSSDDDERHVPKQAVRGKRRIISDDEDEESHGEGGEDESAVGLQSRPTKRARVLLSDSEDEEEMPSRVRRRRTVPTDLSEDSSVEGEEVANGEEDDEEESEEDEEEEEEQPRSKSLMERLRQFRSDNPISPEDEDSNQSEEDEEGGDLGYGEEFEEHHGAHYDDEFPESEDDESY